MTPNKSIQDVKDKYANESWGKFLIEMDFEPYDTESSARRVAECAAEKIDKLNEELKILRELKSLMQEAFQRADREHLYLGLGYSAELPRPQEVQKFKRMRAIVLPGTAPT